MVVLYLATLTHRSRLTDINDDVFMFVKDRFFVNEVIDAMVEGQSQRFVRTLLICRFLRMWVPDDLHLRPFCGRCIEFSISTFSGLMLRLSLLFSPSCLFCVAPPQFRRLSVSTHFQVFITTSSSVFLSIWPIILRSNH